MLLAIGSATLEVSLSESHGAFLWSYFQSRLQRYHIKSVLFHHSISTTGNRPFLRYRDMGPSLRPNVQAVASTSLLLSVAGSRCIIVAAADNPTSVELDQDNLQSPIPLQRALSFSNVRISIQERGAAGFNPWPGRHSQVADAAFRIDKLRC